MKIADPKPGWCSRCYNAKDEYVDCESTHDSGMLINTESQALIQSQDDLFICRACVQEMCEVLNVKPEREMALRRDIRRLSAEAGYWKDLAVKLEATIHNELEKVA